MGQTEIGNTTNVTTTMNNVLRIQPFKSITLGKHRVGKQTKLVCLLRLDTATSNRWPMTASRVCVMENCRELRGPNEQRS